MHEFSWGAMSSSLYRAFQFGYVCGWVCLRLCICGACMCESAHSHPCFQMGVSLVSGASMIGRRRRMPSPSVKMRCTVYAESACSVWRRLLHLQQCTHCDIKPQDRNIEGLVCAQDTIKHSTNTRSNTQHETAKESRWCLELLMTLWLMHCTCLPNPKRTDDYVKSKTLCWSLYKWQYTLNSGCVCFVMLLHQKCERCLFQMSVCLSLILSLRDQGCGCYRNHLAGLNCFFLVFISSYWTSVSFFTLIYFFLSFSFSPPVSWICMDLVVETLFKTNVRWSPSLSRLSLWGLICSAQSLTPSFVRGNTGGSV